MRAVLAKSVLLRHQFGHSESFPTPRAESPHLGPGYHRIVRDTCAAETIGTIRNRDETIVASQLSSRSGSSKIPASVSARRRTRPGPKGPGADLIRAVVEIKQRNPR
jgi:hypothetical protein